MKIMSTKQRNYYKTVNDCVSEFPRDWELVWLSALQCLGSVYMWLPKGTEDKAFLERQWQPKHPKWKHFYQAQHPLKQFWVKYILTISSTTEQMFLETNGSQGYRISTKWGLKNWHWRMHPACQIDLLQRSWYELYVARFILLEVCAQMSFLTYPWISKSYEHLKCKLRLSCFYLRLPLHLTGEAVKLK